MPQITNTFLKSKMNKDLDSRLIPNGEYRDAQNLNISRSEGAEVGEFENILQNRELAYLYTGRRGGGLGSIYSSPIIGQYTDETTENIYIFSAAYPNNDRCPRDVVVYGDPAGLASTTLIELYDAAGNLLDPTTLGLEVGMLLWGDSWDGQPSGAGGQEADPVITFISTALITVSQPISFAAGAIGDKITIGWNNTIHRYNPTTDVLTLLVRGSFLNFSKNFKIYGINLIDDLLFWTDNRNQPRKINVDLANPTGLISPTHYVNEDQISVAKYYPYETPLVLQQSNLAAVSGTFPPAQPIKGYQIETSAWVKDYNVKIGDIVTGFPGQTPEEVWEVIWIEPSGGNDEVIIYNNFLLSPGTAGAAWAGGDLKFSRPSSVNSGERLLERGFDTTCPIAGAVATGAIFTINYTYLNQIGDPSPQPTPQIGDFITSPNLTGPSGLGITLADEVVIQEITTITPGVGGTITMKLTQPITVNAVGDDVSISVNPNYGLDQVPSQEFTGDPDLVEEKFIRFSYRFKFEDNEYSLSAPFTQICFIPKQEGIFGNGKNDQTQDMTNAYDSSIIEWFTNSIDTVSLKIPLPDTGTTAAEAVDGLINGYKVTDIEILYKESDAVSTKILEVIQVNNSLTSFVEEIPLTIPGAGPQWYYNFDYKSIKPYRTLPTSQQNRVYDNVPLKALAQELTANRVMYGNFLQQHTPPSGLDYEALNANKSVLFDNYVQYPNHSLKQNRNYQVGFVLADRYGRASSVVLSTNDSNPDAAGSTVYTPYKTWTDVEDPINDVTTYKWLGNVLRVKLNNGITQITNNEETGEPGLYKAESDTSVDSITIDNGGINYAVGDTIKFKYQTGVLGLGNDLEAEVTSETGGAVTGLKILNRGNGYVNGNVLDQDGTSGIGTGIIITVVVHPANPTGWQSYKIVVKQQEQEYYNVYLPGYVSGYPVLGAPDYGRVAFAALLGDNINKVPRDLNEVGPLQTEFSASIKLFGRVNNPNINNNQKAGAGVNYYENRPYAWNTQYFPQRVSDETVTVGPIGTGGLELATSPFDATAVRGEFTNTSPGAIPWGNVAIGAVVAGANQSFYNVNQNPLALGLAVGTEESQPQLTIQLEPQLNTLGAKVTNVAIPAGGTPVASIGCMYPYLSVSETLPVESQLEIFYESSTSGNFVDLNRLVVSEYGGVSGTTTTFGAFAEDDPNPSDVITAFSFTDSSGNQLTLQSVPLITQVLDGNGVDVTGAFTIRSTGGGASLIDFDIQTNQLFAYLKGNDTTGSGNTQNDYFISFETTYVSGPDTFVDQLNNQIKVTLTNVAPTIGGFTPSYGADAGVEKVCGFVGGSSGYTTLDTGVFGQFTNSKNGSIDATQDTLELCYSLALTAAPVGSTATFSIDQTGVVTLDVPGTTVNGTYEFTCTVTDASPSCSNDPNSLTATCVYEIILGTPPVNRILCYGPTASMAALNSDCATGTGGTGNPMEVFFGANRFINSGIVGMAGPLIGSGTQTLLFSIDTALASGSNGYTAAGRSANSLNLEYYNVLEEGRYGSNPIQCGLPPVTEAFTTGALTQGILTIKPVLSKGATAASPSEYKTNFTILYRATAADPWQLAQCDVGSPAQPAGGTVGNFNLLTVLGAGATSASLEYNFSIQGEYAVRNNGVYGVGCQVSGCYTCARFDVEYYDAQTGAVGNCVTCLGPL